jgi:hypothetical protein
MKKYQVFLLLLAVVSLGIVLSGCMSSPPTPPTPSIPNVTGFWNLSWTTGGQSYTYNGVLLLQNQDDPSEVALLLPFSPQSGSYEYGGFGFTGSISGNEITLFANSSIAFQGTISNGSITGTCYGEGQFQMSNMQPISTYSQNFDINGSWQFTINDWTNNSTYKFTSKIYQNGSYIVSVPIGEYYSEYRGESFFGTLQGNSITFNLNTIQMTGTISTNYSMSGNYQNDNARGTWSATFISSY